MAKRKCTNAFDQLMKSSKIIVEDDPEIMTLQTEQEESSTVMNNLITEEIENPTLLLKNQRIIYKFFNKVNDTQSMCITCKKVLISPSSTTTTLKRHLKTHTKPYLKYETYVEQKKKN